MTTQRNDSKDRTTPSIADNGAAIDQPSMDANGAAAERAMASYGVARDDSVWVTECAWCKRTRNRAGDWFTLNATVRAAMGVERTHGICPQCARAAVARAEETLDGRAQ
jgi:hypothetical protein